MHITTKTDEITKMNGIFEMVGKCVVVDTPNLGVSTAQFGRINRQTECGLTIIKVQTTNRKQMKQHNNIPQLRFPEFDGEWEERPIKNIISDARLGGNYRNLEISKGLPLIKMGNIGRGKIILDKKYFLQEKEEYNENDILKDGDFLFNTRNTLELVGKVAIWQDELPLALYNSNLLRITFNDEIESTNRFINYLFNTYSTIKSLRRFAIGTTSVAAIYSRDLYKLKVKFPTLPEQQKIAHFLTAVDKRIQLLTRKKEQLELYKKGTMQKIFNRQIRFKDEKGREFPEWEEKKLGEVFDRVTRKNTENNNNVLTISAQNGLVNQLLYFNNSVSGKDLQGYYLLEKGDFAYNRSYSRGYPMGATKRLKNYTKGVVSTLYICFRSKRCIEGGFAEKMFESGVVNKEIYKVAQEGARNHGLLNIGVGDYFAIRVVIPTLPEQQKIAQFLTALDKKIAHTTGEIEKMKEWKRGLLQKLFV
ncbi:restriction endonuclease subunit S [Marinilabilia sp.]|uniref:restriction endonuclease subunit S n=1 Tax=Marinilabilia sp. TaxID=2021252 RepID=UPI0025B8FA81|nr:restriction endonuclease subunit S [Marinilabilia sp.]